MSSRRRSEGAVEYERQVSASPVSSEGSATGQRQTSIRLSRRATNGNGNSSGRGVASNGIASAPRSQRSTGRVRRATPIVRRRRQLPASDEEEEEEDAGSRNNDTEGGPNQTSYTDEEVRDPVSGRRQRRIVAERRGPHGGRRLTVSTQPDASGEHLCWYERMMPEFLLNMTSPITGYESRLDSDVEEDEYEILERQRLRRNKRIRRRLLTLMLAATAAGVLFYTRGRLMRRVGVKAAVSTMKHRIEDGLAKRIQDTMGN